LFRQYNSRFEERDAQVLGISCDTVASHRAWGVALGGLPYPELSDFHPRGEASQAYDLWNPERGSSNRAVLIIDKGGIIRYRKTYAPGTLPEMDEILGEVEKLG
jgi:alkyl hydroperoxide reductase subunit AhpC